METKQVLLVSPQDAGKRVDSFLSEHGMTRNAAQHLLSENKVYIAAKTIKKNYKVTAGESITVYLPEIQAVDILPENIPIDILYEDQDIIIVNKARGMVVHPAAGNWNGTLVNALMYHCGERLSGINGEIRPGIVHRIDKDTSGLLVVAKNDIAHQGLAAQLEKHDMQREYEAIVYGTFRQAAGIIDQPIARHKTDRKRMAVSPEGKRAVTHYQALASANGYSYMAFKLETGRTHQIRVHMAYAGHPIIGDPVYGAKKDKFESLGGQCLHAKRLHLIHPVTGNKMCFEAPLPDYFCTLLQKLQLINPDFKK